MSVSATLTMLVSTTSSSAPSATASAMSHLFREAAESGGAASSMACVTLVIPETARMLDSPAALRSAARGQLAAFSRSPARWTSSKDTPVAGWNSTSTAPGRPLCAMVVAPEYTTGGDGRSWMIRWVCTWPRTT